MSEVLGWIVLGEDGWMESCALFCFFFVFVCFLVFSGLGYASGCWIGVDGGCWMLDGGLGLGLGLELG